MLSPQLLRFLLVGVLNTAVGYGLFAGFTWLGLPYPVAIGLATLLGIAFNFQSTGRIVFGGAQASRLWRFVAVYGVVYLINVAALSMLLRTGMGIYLANGLLVLPLALIAFVLQKKIVFASS